MALQVQQYLESAGFSRSNPYNIVEQGKIMRMSQMKDAERLDMLKEVGGARVYELKRKESKRTMEEQASQVRSTDETVRCCFCNTLSVRRQVRSASGVSHCTMEAQAARQFRPPTRRCTSLLLCVGTT